MIILQLLKNLNHHLERYKLKKLFILSADNFEVSKQPIRKGDHSWRFFSLLALSLSSIHVFLDLLDWFEALHHLFLVNHVANRRKIRCDVCPILILVILINFLECRARLALLLSFVMHLNIFALSWVLIFFNFAR